MIYEEKESICYLLYWALIEIRLETAKEDGNLLEGYEKIWQLSHLMHSVPWRILRIQNEEGYLEILKDVEMSVSALAIADWFKATLIQETSNEKQSVYKLLNQTFIDLHKEGLSVKNKKIITICNLVQEMPLRLAVAQAKQDYVEILGEINKRSDFLHVRRWVDRVSSYRPQQG